MSSLSPLRRSPPLIHRLPTLQRLQIRLFSSPPPPPQFLNSNFDANFGENENPSGSNPFLGWVSGIVTVSSLGLALYWYFPDSKKSIMNLVDWSTPNSTQAKIVDVQSSNPKFLFGDAYRRKIFFNYEKRIRMRSPPEKVFEYFASFQSPEGEILMRPADLMRAIVPVFPPSESHLVRDGYLRGERSPGELRCHHSEFFMLFDLNNDGLISFKEYIFFVSLLSIPESSFAVAFKMFDINGNGEIDKAEFKKVMAMMRSHNRQGAHANGLRAGLKVGGSVENGGLVEFFFGEDGKKCLQLNKFIQFLGDLHNEMTRLEFSHYDYKLRGSISAKDFALSMVASADLSHLNKLLDRVDDIDNEPRLNGIRITFEEFKNFGELHRRLQPFSLALFSYGKVNGLLTRKDFQRAASQVCGISLADNVIEIIFHVFDKNHDGTLSFDEFIRVLQKREMDIAHPTEAGILSFLSCFLSYTDKGCKTDVTAEKYNLLRVKQQMKSLSCS